MELDLLVMGSLDSIARADVRDDEMLEELRRRGLSEADANLALDQALLRGLVVRAPSGLLRRGAESNVRQALASETPDSQ